MAEWAWRDLVCLHLAAHEDARGRSTVPRAVAADGIGDAIEVGEGAASRVRLVEVLGELEDAGLVTSDRRPVEGFETPRTAYFLTEAGAEHAAELRESVADETVVVTDGTTEEVPLSEVGQYVESETPMVTALARLTEDGEVPLRRPSANGFVGREGPLETVREAIADSISRASRTVVVGGAAGIGKTALVAEAVDRARADAPELVAARGDCPAEPTAPYVPLRQAFERVGGDLVDALPDGDPGSAPSAPHRVDVKRTALFDDVADALREAATERPIVLFLDNLQWADPATLSLFAHLTTTVTEWVYPVAFVATYRSTAVATEDHPLPEVLERVERGGRYTELTLEPLDQQGTAALLADVVGTRGLPGPFVELVHEETGGVPLFVRETATHLVERGLVDPAGEQYPEDPETVSVPDAVTDELVERLTVLAEPTRELLRLGAVVGEYLPAAVLSAASDLPESTHREHVDLLVASHVWERVPESPDGTAGSDLRFVSGAMREAVLDRLSPSAAREYHERVAEAVVAVHDDDDAHAARVAHHFEQAGATARAVSYYRRAGDHAKAAFADDSAVGSYERALALAADADEVGDGERAATVADLAEVHLVVGRFDEALSTAESALELPPSDSRERARLLGVAARAAEKLADTERAEEAATRQRELAADIGDDELRAEAIRVLGVLAEGRGEYDVARERFERSLSLAREAGDRWGEATCLKNLGGVALRQGDHDDARASLRESIDAYRELGDRQGEARCLNNLGEAARRQGDLERAVEHLERSLGIKRELGNRPAVAATLGNLGLVAESRGNLDRAREQFEEGVSVFREVGDTRGEAKSLGNLALLARRQADYEEAREYYLTCLDRLRELGDRPDEGNTLHNLGLVALARGRFDRARQYFRRALSIYRDIDGAAGEAVVLNSLGRAAVEVGDREAARDHLEAARSVAEDVEDRREVANSRHWLGELALRRGDHDRARDHLEAALEADEAGGMELAAAEVRLSLGRLALAEGDREHARDLAERTRTSLDDMGADHEAARARRLLGRVDRRAGDHEAARDHLGAALSTFDRIGADDDALATVALLVGLADDRDDDERLAAHCGRAEELLAAAPPATAEKHREWVERRCGN